jgi:hypothetical protein
VTKRSQFLKIVAVGAFLVLPSEDASAEPTKVAAFFDAGSREHFELFQKHDGSFFCLVQNTNGVLSRFHVRSEEGPGAAGLDPAQDRLDLRKIIERNRKGFPSEDMWTLTCISGKRTEETDLAAGEACSEWKRANPNGIPCGHPCKSGDRPGREKSVGWILLLLISGQGAS